MTSGKVTVTTLVALLADTMEVAVVDVRDQEDFIRGQILASINIPYDRMDTEAEIRIPRKLVSIILVGDDNELVTLAEKRLTKMGYLDVKQLVGGLAAWEAAGLPIFEDVNAESKAFGEFVEHSRKTPEISPEALAEKLTSRRPPLLLDCRPEPEHVYGHVPGAIHLPSGDMFAAITDLLSNSEQEVVVHCGGRTRGIIAAQALRDAGLANPVSVLENGCMGWHLAGFSLETGLDSSRQPKEPLRDSPFALCAAGRLAKRAKVSTLDSTSYEALAAESEIRTLYTFDLRPYNADSPLGAQSCLSVQLIQATDQFIAVRGARVVLIDDDPARAVTTAAWLKQMGWHEVWYLPAREAYKTNIAKDVSRPSAVKADNVIHAQALSALLDRDAAVVVDVSQSHDYLSGHIPGAWFCPRRQLSARLPTFDRRGRQLVLTATIPAMAFHAANDIQAVAHEPVYILSGGTPAWQTNIGPLQIGAQSLLGETSWLNPTFAEEVIGKEKMLKAFVDWELERFFDTSTNFTLEEAMSRYLTWEIDLAETLKADPGPHFSTLDCLNRPDFAGDSSI